jgi:iron uptake system component EfeO
LNASRALASAACALLAVVAAAACSTTPAASAPAAASAKPGSASSVTVTITSSGCVPTPTSVPAGTITFSVTNDGADTVTELELLSGETVVGERENLTPGLTGTFSVQLAAGAYILECPGATTDESPFNVTP